MLFCFSVEIFVRLERCDKQLGQCHARGVPVVCKVLPGNSLNLFAGQARALNMFVSSKAEAFQENLEIAF
jgi:hypothetical protein